MSLASSKGIEVLSLSAATTGTGTSVNIPISSNNPRINVRGVGTISGGTLILEEASSPAYTGTWSQLLSITASALTGGAEQVVHILGTLGAVRGRISSNITGGGSVTVGVISD